MTFGVVALLPALSLAVAGAAAFLVAAFPFLLKGRSER